MYESRNNVLPRNDSALVFKQMDLSADENRPVLVTAITASAAAILIRGQLRYMQLNGFQPVLISSSGPEVEQLAREEGIELVTVPMHREIAPIADLVSLCRVIRAFRRIKPVIINAGTPKAGLLCMIAGWLCRVPVRIYTVRGFRHESASPRLRWLLIRTERLACRLAHKILCISPSVMDLGIAEDIFPREKAVVTGAGSSNGIDLQRFSPNRFTRNECRALRENLGIGEDELVIGFVGRLIPRKGVAELLEAWQKLRAEFQHIRLLIVGPFEGDQALQRLPQQAVVALKNDPSIVTTGFVPDVERYFSIMDIFTLPAHWEGFGNVLIQAAAMKVPAVTTDVTGAKDAVKANYNAFVVPAKSPVALADALRAYISDAALRKQHGENGRTWVESNFAQEAVWRGISGLYNEMLAKIKASQ